MRVPLRSYQELEVWKLGMELAKAIYPATQALPKYETYALADQLRRAAVSIPTNIAEGYQRNHRKEYLQYLSVAAGSQAELTTLLILAREVHSFAEAPELLQRCETLGKMLTNMRNTLKNPTP